MKTLLTKYSLLALVVAMLGLSSCTEEDGPIGPGGSNNGVTGLSATALSSTSIGVRWSGGTSADQVVVTPVTGGSAMTVNSSNGQAVVTGLTLGQEYTIRVDNANGSSNTMEWAPARRWPFETNGQQTVRVYSTAAPGANRPSGLIIDETGIQAVSVGPSAPNRDQIDLVLATTSTNPNNPIAINSPHVQGSGIPEDIAKVTLLNQNSMFVQGGLDNHYYTGDVATLVPTGNNAKNQAPIFKYASGDAEFGKSMIIIFRTEENHFGRLEIVPQADGTLFGSDQALNNQGEMVIFDYVDVRVSYQTLPNTGYVGRPQARPSSTPNPTINVIK
jgi:hypothetical protein